jgi:DNA-directed RNA polymerase
MDASHMSLVINKLHDENIASFGAIHDSYSVHADDVDRLLEVTKEVFVEMYDNDIFSDMKRQFIGNDDEFEISSPDVGNLDLNDLKKSDYFFC